MSATDHIAFVDEELAAFKDSLKRYQEQTRAWYSQWADDVSRLNDLPSLMGMERVIKVGDGQKPWP